MRNMKVEQANYIKAIFTGRYLLSCQSLLVSASCSAGDPAGGM